MTIDLHPLIRPRSIAVLGASATRTNNGNVVVVNLRAAGYGGTVIPIHPSAPEIEGFSCVQEIADLPAGIDCAVVSVPAAGVLPALQALDAAGTATAIVMTSGFSATQDTALRDFMATSRILVQGPNCMGLLNVTDAIPLYTAIPSERIRPGRAALVAQSGSAAISLINSTDVGFSKIITSGSQFRLDAADFVDFLAADDATAVIGLVLESLPDPDRFADAADRAHQAGRALVVLKVGQSATGSAAAQAHTGALVTDRDAGNAWFRRYGIPTVADYDEMIAALDTFATIRRPRRHIRRIGIAGISGGEAALTCDLAEPMGVTLSQFTPATVNALQALLPGTPGRNPIDFGASVAATGTRREADALDVIAADPEVDLVFVLQDAQHSLAWRSKRRYIGQVQQVAELGTRTDKPVVIVSSSGEALQPEIAAARADTAIPFLRGLRPALAAMKCLETWSGRTPEHRRQRGRALSPEKTALRDALGATHGPVAADLTARLLAAYALPLVRSVTVHSAEEAVSAAAAVGYPMVVKVLSRDVPHRSEIGAVQLGIADPDALRAAIATIARNVEAARPGAIIEGFELQEQLDGWVEAVVGLKSTPPYGALLVAGTGGALVELMDDRALSLCPVTHDEAIGLIAETRLGRRLGGYRNLLPQTALAPLAGLLVAVSELAADMAEVLAEADLNPVLVRPGSGEVRVVDALFIAR